MEFFAKAQGATPRFAYLLPLLASGLALGGCMSSPTYGTDKTANEQLMSDVGNMISLAPKRKPPIDYEPRPDLVKPDPNTAENMSLPPPQDSVASANNPDWPESPEARRARLLKETTANQDNPNFKPTIVPDDVVVAQNPNHANNGDRDFTVGNTAAQSALFKKKLAQSQQGSPTTRKYLSEPPLTYRQPAATAPSDELGEDESKKERRAKAATGKRSWRDWIPGL